MLNDEAELAGVLAHEIGHVLRRHHLESFRKQAQRNITVDLATLMAGKSSVFIDTLVNAGMQVYAKGLDKDDEYESDIIGIVIASRAGYDPYGLPGTLMTIDSINPDDENITFMSDTHPPASDRIERLDMLTARYNDVLTSGPTGTERLQSIQQGISQ